MIELFGALIAGVLTTLAPCVLPLLPIIVGGSMAGALAEERAESATGPGTAGTTTQEAVRSRSAVSRALVITISLGVSILVFTLALKATTPLIGIPPQTWQWVSGGVLIALGVVGAFPDLWERLSARLGLQSRSAQRLGAARRRDGVSGEILTGAALGPVFTSCSPLYGYVIVTVLPAEPVRGLVLLGVYILGLCATLLLIALAGQRVVARFGWAADSHGWFRRGLGIVFIVVGVLVATGAMKSIETWIVVNAPFAPWNLDSQFMGDATMNLVTLRAADPSPSELVARVAAGDEEAFRMLYRSHSAAAYGLALRVTRDGHMAQDVLQEAFADLWAQAGRFDPHTSSVRSWITMLTHRRAVDRVRREQGDRDRVSHWVTSSRERDHDSVAEVVEIRAEHRRVRQAMEGLTGLQRESLELAFLGGLTHTEVAAHLDIPLGTAKTRIRDALRSLRTELEGDL